MPVSPSSPNTFKNTVVGGAVVMLALAAFYVIRYLMDDTIKTEEDVRRYLGLNTLAAIPAERKTNGAA